MGLEYPRECSSHLGSLLRWLGFRRDSLPDSAGIGRSGSAWVRHYATGGGANERPDATGTGHFLRFAVRAWLQKKLVNGWTGQKWSVTMSAGVITV